MILSTGRSIMIIIILLIIKATEAWPLSIKKNIIKNNKNNIKKVSAQNSMIPAQVPRELQDLTQTKFSQ